MNTLSSKKLAVRLLKDVYDDGQDHHPPGYVGRKGDVVYIHSVQTAVVSHDGTGHGFIVHDGELDLVTEHAHETGALPSLEELLANLPPDADERLANAINTSERLEALSNQALVDIALAGCFEGSPTSTLVLHEMCSRLHPGWENEIPEEDAPAPKANEGQT